MNKNKLIFRFSLLALWCIVIFCYSAQNGTESTNESNKVFEIVKIIFFPNFDSLYADEQYNLTMNVTHYIRKTAHFMVFAFLGFLSYFTLFTVKNKKKRAVYSVLISFVCACTDEFHQFFVPDRNAQITDVFIDTCGSILGTALAILLALLFFRYKNWRNAEKACNNPKLHSKV